jgi:serine protease Do
MSVLDEISTLATGVSDAVGKSVVRVGRHGGRGAGVVIASGAVLTSAHNLRGSQVTITFPDGRSEQGEVAAVDAEGDLAVVSVDTGEAVPVTWPAEGDGGPKVGSVVFAAGPVAASGGNRLTVGFVSATGVAFRGPRGRLIVDGFEHTAFVGRGSSGGPVVDGEGRLVGLNTHRPAEGSYLAIPATSALKARVDALARGEIPTRRRLGVALAPSHVARRLRAAVGLPDREGVLIREVGEGSPAEAGGLRRGDLVIRIGADSVDSVDSLARALDGLGDAESVEITVVRGSEEVAVTVAFAPESSD